MHWTDIATTLLHCITPNPRSLRARNHELIISPLPLSEHSASVRVQYGIRTPRAALPPPEFRTGKISFPGDWRSLEPDMPSTILSVLTRPNPPVRPQNIRASSNTIGRYYLNVESWVLWRDFNYKTLKSIFPVVNASWEHVPAKVKFSRLDSTFSDEDGFEHQILDKELIPTGECRSRTCKTRTRFRPR